MADALEALARARCPAFRVGEELARSVKCLLVAGHLDGRPVVLKHLARDLPPWRWYFERERALLTALRSAPAPVRTPALLDAGDDWLLVERIDGTTMARGRVAHDLDAAQVRAALDASLRWGESTVPLPRDLPDAASLAEIRSRLLEDPSAPLDWCTEGLARGVDLGLVSGDIASRAIDALRAHPLTRRSHGDLLPRNVIATPDGATLVDLECAGPHPEAWDHALLWANVAPALRPAVEAHFGVADDARGRAFLACVAFALVRELKFARGGGRTPALARDLAAVADRLR